jgi:hypothetical protein
MSAAIGQIVSDLTAGRPFVFMVMPYGEKYPVFLAVQRAVEATLGLACLRADHAKASGHDLLSKIHLLLERAELVIAEISPTSQPDPTSPNVFYEIGYAKALQKPLLLLIEEGQAVPTDLKGLEVIRYSGSRSSFEQFGAELCEHLKTRLTSRTALLRDMLLADEPRPSFAVASPKYPTGDSRIPGHVKDRKTFGDNLGVLGLISAFGTMLGEHADIELISGRFCDLNISESPANLYLIGSYKANDLSREVLEKLQLGSPLSFRFGPYPGEEHIKDHRVVMYRRTNGTEEMLEGDRKILEIEGWEVHTVDYGIIVRGPHPRFPGRIAMVMAGAHSLGTGAACVAATNSRLISLIQEKLPKDVRLSDKQRTIYAYVKGKVDVNDNHLYANGVEILEAGELKPSSPVTG